MLRLRYFGPFAATRDGTPVAAPTKPAARLLAYLAREPGVRYVRATLARTIWPDALYGSELASLRNALAVLRGVAGRETVQADRDEAWTERNEIESDLARVRRAIRSESIEPDAFRRAALLSEISEILALPYLEGWEGDWIEEERAEFRSVAARAAFDLARHHERAHRMPEAREAALRALRARPHDERAIALVMRIERALGDRDAALAVYARASGPSDDLRELAAEIRRTPLVAPPAPGGSDVLTAVESSLQENPEANARFLIAHRVFPYFQADVERAKALYARVLRTPGVPDELRAPLLVSLARLSWRTADFSVALDLLREAEDRLGPGEQDGRDDLLTLRAMCLTEQGGWAESERILTGVLEGMEPSFRLASALCLLAVIQGQTGRFDEMLATSERALSFDLKGDARYAYACAHVSNNLACLAIAKGEWAEAERLAGAVQAYFEVHPDPYGAAFSGSAYWLARAAQGAPEAGPQLARIVGEPVRLGMRRVALFVLDYVAEGMARLGRGAAAVELLRATEVFRVEIGSPRSPTEERNAARTREIARELPGPESPPAPDDVAAGLGPLALWTAERLEEPFGAGHES